MTDTTPSSSSLPSHSPPAYQPGFLAHLSTSSPVCISVVKLTNQRISNLGQFSWKVTLSHDLFTSGNKMLFPSLHLFLSPLFTHYYPLCPRRRMNKRLNRPIRCSLSLIIPINHTQCAPPPRKKRLSPHSFYYLTHLIHRNEPIVCRQ